MGWRNPDFEQQRLFFAAGACLAVLALTACTAPQESTNVGGPSPGGAQIIHASHDDCEIIAEVGKAKFQWGADTPTAALYSTYDQPGGGSYVEDCDWGKFGLGTPKQGGPDSESGFTIARPAYSGDRATVEAQSFVRSKGFSPFMQTMTCTLEKRKGHWHLIGCALNAIT